MVINEDKLVDDLAMSKVKKISDFEIAGQLETIFGSKSAAYVLLFVEAYGSGYASQIAKTFDMPLNGAQQQLRKFEADGIFASYTVGKTRIFEFNPRSATVRNLRTFLAEELKFLSSESCDLPKELFHQLFSQRQRPRRTDKPSDIVPERLRI